MADNNAKDLDFDELHEAVNALMDKAQKSPKKTDKPASQPPEDHKPAPEPSMPKETEDNSIKVNVKRPLPPVMQHHRGSHGRAMDVVSPREAPRSIMPPSARATREAPTLQPTQHVRPESPAPLSVPERAPLHESPDDLDDLNDVLSSLNIEESAHKPAVADHPMTHQKSEWPDPLEIASKNDVEASKDEPTDAAEPEEPAPTVEATEPEKPDSAGPFVTTKVEKRPLGAYADTAKEPDEPKVKEGAEAKESKDAPSPLPPQQLPAEFDPEVLAVESTEQEPGKEQKSESEEPDQPDLRAMSIPHQYKEAEDSSDDSPRPVFDTKEYHPAIEAHTSHHHTSSATGAWVMAIILLLLLVAILVAAYYFITGDLDFSALFS